MKNLSLCKAPGDVPESTERQADLAVMQCCNGVKYNPMRMHQIRIRTMNSYGEINTRYPK